MLSRVQERTLRAINMAQTRNGWPPSFRELCKELGVTLNAVHQTARRLERKGLLVMGGGRGRAMTLTPDGLSLLRDNSGEAWKFVRVTLCQRCERAFCGDHDCKGNE